MPFESTASIDARAIAWHIRLRDGDDATWESFAEWLAEDPRHAAAYEAVEQADLAIEPLLPHLILREAANDGEEEPERPMRRARRWVLAGGALAASGAAAALLLPNAQSQRYEVATRPGERRVIQLDPATQVTLNGATQMTFDRANPRFASLAKGEALFQVRHDSANPFRLEVGDNLVEDAGTIFNVVHEAGEVRVAVAEGRVVYNPRRRPVALDAGQALVDRGASHRIDVAQVPVERVGSWKYGSLVYSAAPLSRVAADLSRSMDVRIRVAPAIADRPFSGTIALDGSGSEQFRRLQLALNVSLEKGRDGWIMRPAGSATR
ncbi:FecR family protein [Sphingomonas sp. DT-207]|uniref:FecR family protein n=1 Tax=Sphingomonas sp. DT-207 TaxID=3396167 RepID=UPI003F19B678